MGLVGLSVVGLAGLGVVGLSPQKIVLVSGQGREVATWWEAYLYAVDHKLPVLWSKY